MKSPVIFTILLFLLFSSCDAKDWQKIDASPVPVSFELPKGFTVEKKEVSPNYIYNSKISNGKDSIYFSVFINQKPKNAPTQARMIANFYLNILQENMVSGRAFLHNGRVVYEIKSKEGSSHAIKRFMAFGNDYFSEFIVYSNGKFADKEADYLLKSIKSNAPFPDYGMPLDEYVAEAHYAFSDHKNWMLDYTMPWVKDSSGLSFRISKNYFIDTTINDTTNSITYKHQRENNRICSISIETKDTVKTQDECETYIHNEFLQLKENDTMSKELTIRTTKFKVNGYPAVKCYIDSKEDEAVYLVIMIAFKQYEVFLYLEKGYVNVELLKGISHDIKFEEEDQLIVKSLRID